MIATPAHHARLTLATEAATAALARRIAPLLAPGHTILLSGPLGAGKTHFARALIQHLLAASGRAEDVPSPTFTLVQVYDAAGNEVWHADLYRLTSADDVTELGLTDAFDQAICLVEWPDRLGALAPAEALSLVLTPDRDGDGRQADLSAKGARWSAVFAALGSAA